MHLQQASLHPDTAWTSEYSPEHFCETEPAFAVVVSPDVGGIRKPETVRKVLFHVRKRRAHGEQGRSRGGIAPPGPVLFSGDHRY
ncbi:hypothetical protein Y981_00265 [Leptospirillum ferriphilum YSK]|uniref:Uncharacterized protein n=1 Tax=Leptospirillum ferriphilum YSK TaxID=1441628 RepID=A0A059XWU3_9BACT|nr:hypothetical protein Y981_00265 [Leptospirillum ferriphilum YSK]